MPTEWSPEPMPFARLDGRDAVADFGSGGAAIETLFVDLFLKAHAKAPKRIVLDLEHFPLT